MPIIQDAEVTTELVTGPDVNVPSIDGPDGDAVETSDTPTESDAAPDETDQAVDETPDTADQVQPWATGDEEIDKAVAQFAKEMKHLDPNNPEHLKTLKRFADKEKFIKELQSKVSPPATADGLTEFERQVRQGHPAAQTQAQPQQQATPVQSQQQPQPRLDDVGAKWQDPADAYNDVANAWTAAMEKGDIQSFRRLNEVETAVFGRRFQHAAQSTIIPYVERMVQERLDQALKQNLGDVLPRVREQLDDDRMAANTEFAVQELTKLPEFKDIPELRKPDNGPPVIVNGQEFEPTPLNRILAAEPWILDIRITKDLQGRPLDQNTSERLTQISRLKAVARLNAARKIDSEKARSLIDAGKTMQVRESTDKVRKTLNRGSGTSQLSSGQKSGSFMQDLLADNGGEQSFADL